MAIKLWVLAMVNILWPITVTVNYGDHIMTHNYGDHIMTHNNGDHIMTNNYGGHSTIITLSHDKSVIV